MIKFSFILFIVFSITIYAQENILPNPTGSLKLDSQLSRGYLIPAENSDQGEYDLQKKSALLAGAMSFVVPGAGEVYAGNFWKAAVFLAVEAAAITTGIIYDNKGDDQTIVFQDFANNNWSVSQYANFTFDNLNRLNPNVYNDADKLAYYTDNLFNDAAKTSVNWQALNQLESDIGGYYSHRLAPYGDQQYYEMIGKYPQFNPGWSDFNNPDYTYGDPLTPNFHYYSGERGKANDLYNVASKAVLIVVVNHILSAADAAWTARSYNQDLKIRLGLEREQIGFRYDIYPKFFLQIRL